jgi:hypothetical protein
MHQGYLAGSAQGTLNLSHGFGKFLPRSEPHNLLCGDLYAFPGPRVTTLPGIPADHRPFPKIDQRKLALLDKL